MSSSTFEDTLKLSIAYLASSWKMTIANFFELDGKIIHIEYHKEETETDIWINLLPINLF